MKSQQLLELIGEIDDDIICGAQSEKRTKRKLTAIYAAAAAIVLLIGAGIIWLSGRAGDDTPISPAPISPDGSKAAISGTSDKFDTLEQLLMHLSLSEKHGDSMRVEGSKSSGSAADIEGSVRPADAVEINGYSYHISGDKVMISRLDGENTVQVGVMDTSASGLLRYGNSLLVISQADISENELDYEVEVHIKAYSTAQPEAPVQTDSFLQSGSFCAAAIADGRLWIITADGECACGYSRLDDKSQYVPSVVLNGQKTEMDESRLHILGDPTMVKYVSVTSISLDSMEIDDTQVLYGDISCVSMGEDYFTLTVGEASDGRQEVYIFSLGETVGYQGKIDPSAILGVKNGWLSGGQSFELVSVSKYGGEYRLSGMLREAGADFRIKSSRVAVITVSEKMSGYSYVLSDELNGMADLTEVLDKDDRQIMCISQTTENYEQVGRFAFALLDGEPRVVIPELEADHLAGIDNIVYYGSPYGEFTTLIPLGGELYARYGGSPDILRIYDLSDPEQPICVAERCAELDVSERFCYVHSNHADGSIGILVLTPGVDENGEYDYRDSCLVCHYMVYSVDTESGDILQCEASYEIASYHKVTVLDYNGKMYCTTDGAEQAIVLE